MTTLDRLLWIDQVETVATIKFMPSSTSTEMQSEIDVSLCRTCAEKTDPHMRCTCLQEENRSFTGTWVTIELSEALDRGHKSLDVYEV